MKGGTRGMHEVRPEVRHEAVKLTIKLMEDIFTIEKLDSTTSEELTKTFNALYEEILNKIK